MTPSRSRNTAFMSGDGCDHGKVFVQAIVFFLPMVVRETVIPGNCVEHHFASFKFETEIELAQAGSPHGFPQASFTVFAIQHQKATAAGAGNLPPYGSVALG